MPALYGVSSSCTFQTINGTKWHINCMEFASGIYTENINCATGLLYNPYNVSTTDDSGYMDECNSHKQRRCAMGDLSGKLGTLVLEPNSTYPHQTYSFYDENLLLIGPYTSKLK